MDERCSPLLDLLPPEAYLEPLGHWRKQISWTAAVQSRSNASFGAGEKATDASVSIQALLQEAGDAWAFVWTLRQQVTAAGASIWPLQRHVVTWPK